MIDDNAPRAAHKTILYREDDGEIVFVGTGISDESHPGCTKAVVAGDAPIVLRRDRYDPLSGDIRPMSAEQIALKNMPTEEDVAVRVASELASSDRTQVPDFPVDDATREAWRGYRAALRALSQIEGVGAKIAQWPGRPDGIDPVADLRARLMLI